MLVLIGSKLIENLKLFYESKLDHTFFMGYRLDNPLGMLGEYSKSFFSRVLPTSRVGYHAGKPIESVVYCLIILSIYGSLREISCGNLTFSPPQ